MSIGLCENVSSVYNALYKYGWIIKNRTPEKHKSTGKIIPPPLLRKQEYGENIALFDRWIFPVSGVHRVVAVVAEDIVAALWDKEKRPIGPSYVLPGQSKDPLDQDFTIMRENDDIALFKRTI